MAEGQARLPSMSSTGPAEKPKEQAASDGRDDAEDKQLLVRVLKNTTGLMEVVVQSQKSAQVAYSSTMEALSHLKAMLDLSCNVIQSSVQLMEHFSDQRGHAGIQELFQGDPELSVTYNTFLKTLQEAEEADLPSLRSRMKTARALGSCVCAPSSHSEEEDEPDSEKKSHHIQVERVRSEEHMGGAYVTQRRRSPRRSRSAGAAGLSPLLSEEEGYIQPVIQSPNRQSRRCSTSKVIHRERSDNWDSDSDRSPGPPPSSNPNNVTSSV